MNDKQREIFQQIMGLADVIDGMRDWLNYYEIEGNLNKTEVYTEQIKIEVARLEGLCKAFRKASNEPR